MGAWLVVVAWEGPACMGVWLEGCREVEPQGWQQGVWQLEEEGHCQALGPLLGRWALDIVDPRKKLLSPSLERLSSPWREEGGGEGEE